MRFILFLYLFTQSVYASEDRWMTVSRVIFRNDELINKGAIIKSPGKWTLIASLVMATHPPDGFLQDCLFVKAPKQDDGEFKILSIPINEDCLKSQERKGDKYWSDLKSVQIGLMRDTIQIDMTLSSNQVERIRSRFLNLSPELNPKIYSSAVGRKVFFFKPNTEFSETKKDILVGELSDEFPKNPCQLEDGSCLKCRFGYYRVSSGEYFCGIDRCGEKNQPACLRGQRWQHTRIKFSCAQENSHVFCHKDMVIDCEGELAICR